MFLPLSSCSGCNEPNNIELQMVPVVFFNPKTLLMLSILKEIVKVVIILSDIFLSVMTANQF